MAIDLPTMMRFDTALARYMAPTFGGANELTWQTNQHWRTMCHQSAKIAARALHLLYPNERVELLRVELKAKMPDSPRFVHIGWVEDTRDIEGKYPMHWAVRVGSGLYDPTFAQLRRVKTPLVLPDEPFFYSAEFFRFAAKPQHVDSEGFTWVELTEGERRLLIGYMVQHQPLPPEVNNTLLPDGLAKRHAKRVTELFRSMKG